MNTTSKSDILALLSKNTATETPPSVPDLHDDEQSCVLIDGHVLVQSLGKPSSCNYSFDDYAKVFLGSVRKHIKESVKRVAVVFDTYIKHSIKCGTRARRSNKANTKIIEHDDVPLPKVWSQFISLEENKTD